MKVIIVVGFPKRKINMHMSLHNSNEASASVVSNYARVSDAATNDGICNFW